LGNKNHFLKTFLIENDSLLKKYSKFATGIKTIKKKRKIYVVQIRKYLPLMLI
jgi:hypothetical protein